MDDVVGNADWLKRDEAVLAGVLPRCSNVVADYGKGSYLWDVDGKKYLDFTSGIAVTNTGHCHPTVVDAIQYMAETLIHTSVTTHNAPTIRLAERLADTVPFFEDPQVFFCNSGAEAVDGALKLARIVTGKPRIVAFNGAFHGRTLGATSITTAKEKYHKPYEPLLAGVYTMPYGNGLWELEMLQHQKFPPNIGAMIVEPVLGEGGYVVPPRGWLQDLRDYCNEYGILLVFDEVQTGIGRTGQWFAAETFGVTPDVILFAKGIASGLPLGGIIAPRTVMEQWPTGTHGSTFGGNPVSCAAALATLDIVGPLLPRVRERGQQLLNRLSKGSCRCTEPTPGRDNPKWCWMCSSAITSPYPVRGVGYMIGIELPSQSQAQAVRDLCQEDGLLVLSCGPEENVLRLIPPLTITDSDLEHGVSILERHLRTNDEAA